MRLERSLRRLRRTIVPAFGPPRGRQAGAAPSADAVHFHRGPQGRPAVCDDPRCTSPQLDV
jgi:hypothetical protein